MLSHVYECFLGRFAQTEGKRAAGNISRRNHRFPDCRNAPSHTPLPRPSYGQWRLFRWKRAALLPPIRAQHQRNTSIYGQRIPAPPRPELAAMNMAIRGIDYDFGKHNADSFTNRNTSAKDGFRRAYRFRVSDWWSRSRADDPRWARLPPKGNANCAWLQHMILPPATQRQNGIVLASGSMSSQKENQQRGEIRKAIINADLVGCMVNALPGQLFTGCKSLPVFGFKTT